jgi:uncharacterized protein
VDDPSLQIALLAVAGVAAGYINTVAGAGSLLTLPALIFTGLDAVSANATNRVAVLFQSGAAVVTFERAGRGAIRQGTLLAVPAGLGAVAGSYLASQLTDAQLRLCIAVAMVVFLVLTLIPRPPTAAMHAPGRPLQLSWLTLVGFAGIGFYAGFLQAGAGVLVLLYLSLVHRVDMVSGNAIKSVLFFLVTVAAIIVFVTEGVSIDPLRGFVLAGATTLGGYLGATATLRRGETFVRIVLVAVVLASVAKLAWDAV